MPITMGMQASRHVRDPRRRIWSYLRGGGFGGCGQNWDRDRRLKNKALRSPLGLVCNAAERRRLTGRSGAPKKPRVAASHGPLPRTTARRWAAAVCARSARLALTALALAFLAAPQDAYAQTQTEAARDQTDPDGFYVGLEMGRAHASTLTSIVTGVNHPTRCDRLLYPASTSPPGQRRGVPRQHADGHPAQRVQTGGRGRERPPGRLPGRPGARRGGVSHPLPGARHRGGRGHHERGAPGQGHRVERRPDRRASGSGTMPPTRSSPTRTTTFRTSRPGRRTSAAASAWPSPPCTMPPSSSGSRTPSTCASTLSRPGRPPPSAPPRAPSAPSIRRCVKPGVWVSGARRHRLRTDRAHVGRRDGALGPIRRYHRRGDMGPHPQPYACAGGRRHPIRHHVAIRGHQLPGGDGRPEVPLLTDPGPVGSSSRKGIRITPHRQCKAKVSIRRTVRRGTAS